MTPGNSWRIVPSEGGREAVEVQYPKNASPSQLPIRAGARYRQLLLPSN
jgi:hypothetical protein